MGVDPLRIDHQAAAGHIHLYAVAGDFALQSQHGHHRSGASAAGIGEVLHAAFKCPLENQIFTGDLVEVHIGTLGKDLVPPNGPAQLPQLVFVRLAQSGVWHHGVGDAGISQLHIGADVCHAVCLHRAIQSYGGGVVQPDAVQPLVDPPAGDDACRGLHSLRLSGQPVFVAIPADAAGTVPTHLTYAAIRIIEQHPIISALGGGIHNHQPVRPDGHVPFTQRPGDLWQLLQGEVLLQVVQNHKVISRAVHFPKSQVSTSFLYIHYYNSEN